MKESLIILKTELERAERKYSNVSDKNSIMGFHWENKISQLKREIRAIEK